MIAQYIIMPDTFSDGISEQAASRPHLKCLIRFLSKSGYCEETDSNTFSKMFVLAAQLSLKFGQLMNLHLTYQNNKIYTLLEKFKLLYIFNPEFTLEKPL